MSSTEHYAPGAASGAHIDKNGDNWTLVMQRELKHSPDLVWQAITDPTHLCQWAPFDASADLGTAGATVDLTTVGAPGPHVTQTNVKRAEKPKLLEYNWGKFELRWLLEPVESGTRLTLWHNIDRPYISMGAAGWHICFDVMDRLLAGNPVGRTVGPDAMKVDGWSRLLAEYSAQLGVEAPKWGNG